jgi:hypothetical protein
MARSDDACIRCKYGLKFVDRHRTYWCRARLDEVNLTGCSCLWDRVCRHFTERLAPVGAERVCGNVVL